MSLPTYLATYHVQVFPIPFAFYLLSYHLYCHWVDSSISLFLHFSCLLPWLLYTEDTVKCNHEYVASVQIHLSFLLSYKRELVLGKKVRVMKTTNNIKSIVFSDSLWANMRISLIIKLMGYSYRWDIWNCHQYFILKKRNIKLNVVQNKKKFKC